MGGDTQAMLDSAGGGSGELASALDALTACEQASTVCATAMDELGGMAFEVHRALDCADVCAATRRVLSRVAHQDPRVVAAVIESAVVACESSAADCDAQADHHEHCRRHSAAAHVCAQALRALQKTAS